VDASVASGPVGRDAAAQVGPGVALLTYSRAKGLYAGVSLGGGVLINNDQYPAAMYGMKLSIRDIILGRSIPVPPEAASFIDTLRIYGSAKSPSSRYTLRERPDSSGFRIRRYEFPFGTGDWFWRNRTSAPLSPITRGQPGFPGREENPGEASQHFGAFPVN
jgi:hypothetical protein